MVVAQRIAADLVRGPQVDAGGTATGGFAKHGFAPILGVVSENGNKAR